MKSNPPDLISHLLFTQRFRNGVDFGLDEEEVVADVDVVVDATYSAAADVDGEGEGDGEGPTVTKPERAEIRRGAGGRGEEMFCLVNLLAVAEFLENVDLDALGLDGGSDRIIE